MAQPMAMSTTRASPVFQPDGCSRLKSTTTNTVNDACPTTKPTADGAYAARKVTTGRATHSNGRYVTDRHEHAPGHEAERTCRPWPAAP